MSTKFSCSICADDKPIGKKLTCPACDFVACTPCQKTFGEPACMSCKQDFTRTFIRVNLGKTYLDTVFRDHVQQKLLTEERNQLPHTQPFVEYERLRNAELSKARFGQRPRLPPLPELSTEVNISEFPCPAEGCRGFVTEGSCGVCQRRICTTCRNIWKDGHVCDVADMASIALVTSDTKNCPKCGVPIHRISGCNHVFCTHCRCHFDWQTLHILQGSTNHHYDNTPVFANNVSTLQGRDTGPAACNDEDIVGLLSDRIPKDAQTTTDADLLRSIYDDAEDLRCLKKSYFDERTQTQKHMQRLIRLRIDFLTGKMDEKKWIRKVYDTKKLREKEMHISSIINMYLVTVRQVQLLLNQNSADAERIKADWVAFLKLSNESLGYIMADYGGKAMTLKIDLHDVDSPAIIM